MDPCRGPPRGLSTIETRQEASLRLMSARKILYSRGPPIKLFTIEARQEESLGFFTIEVRKPAKLILYD
jgi:hypothetical protein